MSQLDPTGLYRLHSRAKTRGGICFAEEYRGLKQKYLWQCAFGHTFEARGDHIVLRRSWCPHCAIKENRLHDGIYRLSDAAAARGGECLSRRYQGMSATYRWRCAQGHEWRMTGASLMHHGVWCGRCRPRGRQLDPSRLVLLQQFAARFGGECLADTYRGMHRRHEWRCAQGHVWRGRPEYMFAEEKWCARCRAEERKAARAGPLT